MNEDTAWLRKVIRWAVSVTLVLAYAQFLVYSFYTRTPVSSGSMQPVLDAGNVVLANRLIYDAGKPERYDIMVFEHKDRKKNVKQIVGLPGRIVRIKGDYIFIDDGLLNTRNSLGQVSLVGKAGTPIKLEDSEYFLLGDNRDSSEGSQSPNIGNIERGQVQGRVWFRMFPLLRLDFIHSK